MLEDFRQVFLVQSCAEADAGTFGVQGGHDHQAVACQRVGRGELAAAAAGKPEGTGLAPALADTIGKSGGEQRARITGRDGIGGAN